MSNAGTLLRILGLGFGLAAVVGNMIGQGILRSPGVVAEATGSAALILGLWILGGLISCLNAFAFAELGCAIPRAGGPYAFIQRAFGREASLFAGLAMLVGSVAAVSYLCYVLGEFLVRLGVGGGAIEPQWFGLIALAVYLAINTSGTLVSGFSQILLSSLKGLVLLGLVVALFASPGADVPASAASPVLRNGWLPLGTAMVVILTTYSGWWYLVHFSEELSTPGRDLPRALFGGILGVAAIYILVNAALLHVMTPDQMAGSNLVAADAAGRAFGARADFYMTCFSAFSVAAIGNLALMTNTRVTYAVARAGILPRWLATVTPLGTPLRAMTFTAVGAGIIMMSGGYLALVTLSETILIPVLIAVELAVIALRRKEPDLPRPYRVPFFPYTLYASAAVLTTLLVVYILQDPFYSLLGFGLVGGLWLLFHGLARLRGVEALPEPDAEERAPR